MPRQICVDFDGVIHSYDSGWKGACEIPDPPIEGAFEFIESLLDHPEGDFKVCIYSSRSKEPGGIEAMQKWFYFHGFVRIEELSFPTQKPAAVMTIDDRAFCFEGTFPTPQWLIEFKPWNKK
jgi:hypothetical protein